MHLHNQALMSELAQVIETQVGSVALLSHWNDLLPFDTPDKKDDLFILITDDFDDSLKNVVASVSMATTIVLYSPKPLSEHIQWFKPFHVRNLVIQTEDDSPTFHELIATLRKITTQAIMGIEQYLPNTVDVMQQTLLNSEER